jgi:hypothetical protein
MGSMGHVIHYGGSGAQNSDTLFFLLGWDQYGFDKKRDGIDYAELVFFASYGIYGSCSAFRCVWGAKRRYTIFNAQVGPVWI